MLVNPSQTPASDSPSLLQHLHSRIEGSKQQIRIGEIEHAVVTEIVAYANFHSLHDELTEKQRQHLLEKFWTKLQTVEQHLQIQRQYLHLSELELARQELIQSYTPQLTQLSEEIRCLKPMTTSNSLEQRLLNQLETMQHHIRQIA